MKKYFTVIITLSLKFSTAQFTGIGTATPAAKLQINHAATFSSPSLLLVDSTAGTGSLIQFSKQSVSGNWGLLSTLSSNAGQSSADFSFNGSSILNLRDNGNTGINNSNPQAALDVNGDALLRQGVLLNNGSGAAGQAFTSNGSGAATWQTASSVFSTGGKLGFFVLDNTHNTGRTGYSVNSGVSIQTDSVDIGLVNYNTGTDFTVTNNGSTGNFITINSSGLYRFEGSIPVKVQGLAFAIQPAVQINFIFNQPVLGPSQVQLGVKGIEKSNSAAFSNHEESIDFSFDRFFPAGTTITLKIEFSGLSDFPLLHLGYSAGFISAAKLSD